MSSRIVSAVIVCACLLGGVLWPAGVAGFPDPTHPFAIEPGSFHVTLSSDQAGAHPDLTTTFNFEHNAKGETFNDLKDLVVNLPPGFIGSNTAVPTCTDAQLLQTEIGIGVEGGCPADTQVGVMSFDLFGYSEDVEDRVTNPVYNLQSNTGVTATLGFNNPFGLVTQILPVSVRPGDTALTLTSPSILFGVEPHAVSFTVWGVPAAAVHNAQRGEAAIELPMEPGAGRGVITPGDQEAHIPVKPFFANPTRCTGTPLTVTMSADSWEEQGKFSEASTEVGPLTGCERVPFHPSLEVNPTANAAESPSGLDASLLIPQYWEDSETLAASHLKDAVVTLPEGYSLNPSAGNGLGVCTEAQLAEETSEIIPGRGCPDESKVGTVEVETPVLTEKALGSVYVAKPFDNPFHSLLALYVVAKVPSRGIIVTAKGKVTPNPVTGQLTTTFDENPQVPFNRFELKFTQGPTSPLTSPPACGTFTAEASLSPWSEPENPRHITNSFEIEHGIGGGACPSGGIPPFHPELHAGTINNLAGSYSPFYVRLGRQDGEQEITHFSIKLPPGVLGKLAGIPFCPQAGIEQAEARDHEGGGAEEEADPSCPATSEVGHTIVEAGVGTVLAQAPGRIYLAGPFHGDQISVVAITAAHVGPFDLGTVVVREGFKVNPETGEVFVDATGSDPIPHIIDGIPTHLRTIRIYMDRPEFVLNPTGCEPTSTTSTVLGSGASFTSEIGIVPVTVSSPFQAADCASLAYKPNLKLSLQGATKRGSDPAFKATLTAQPGEANTARAQVTLPRSEFLEQAHIGTVCTRVQFAEGEVPGERCPAASIYGKARAITPILSEPLEGPVYLRSNGGERKLPDLVAALHNKEVNFDLVGYVEGINGGIRNTFQNVPDAAVTSFTLEMEGGSKGLLVNSTNLCAAKHRAAADFTGHNGKIDDFSPLLEVKCHKKPKKHRKHLTAKRHHRHRGGRG